MKVIITVIRETVYASTVEMSAKDFKKHSKALENESDDGETARLLNRLIDTRDWQHDELSRIESFEEATP